MARDGTQFWCHAFGFALTTGCIFMLCISIVDPCAYDPCAETLYAIDSTCQLVDTKDYECQCNLDLTWNLPTKTCVGGQS